MLIRHGTRVHVIVNIKTKQRNWQIIDRNGWTLMKCRVAEVGSNVRDCKSCWSTRAAELEPEKMGEDCEKDYMFDKPNVYTKQGSGSGSWECRRCRWDFWIT